MLACSRRSSTKRWGNNAIVKFGIGNWELGMELRIHPELQFLILNSQFSIPLFFELHYRNPATALFGRGRCKSRDQWMLLQKPRERSFQLARAVPVDQPNHTLVAEQRFIKKSFGARQRLVYRAADDVEVHCG